MEEENTEGKTPIVIYQNFLSQEEVDQVIAILAEKAIPGTGIHQNQALAAKLVEIIGPKLPEFDFAPYVSTGVTKEAIGKHVDPKLDKRVTHKLLIYLNKTSSGGGTYFKDIGLIKAEVGKAVVFDIDMVHWGEDFPASETKRVFGLRMFKKPKVG